ncbi:MAG: hypothetical protein SGPRY_008368 [Prymnesium sp.]
MTTRTRTRRRLRETNLMRPSFQPEKQPAHRRPRLIVTDSSDAEEVDSSDEEEIMRSATTSKEPVVEEQAEQQRVPLEIGAEDPILILKQEWLDNILLGEKTMEIRGVRFGNLVGQYIWLCASESFKLTDRWSALRERHLVLQASLAYPKTYAWKLKNAMQLTTLILIISQ